ncbi:hypothetical protein [Pseudomonas mandelii]|uniref:hypothetical protein n=1 Tax=Pseudomonas mandelii TaxID=75612 RepID=UPI00224B7892|nr:hypothetical protein [Pseudomonas mandelii]MCX2900637.1 hypothetical protein [Pseudomonas mandelii]
MLIAGSGAVLSLLAEKLELSNFFVVVGVASVFILWLLAFLLRVLFSHFNLHNAQCYGETAKKIEDAWWASHRQKVSLREAVLVGGACSSPEHRKHLFNPDHQPPVPQSTEAGAAIRLLQVFGEDTAERERQLAMLLVLQWQVQREETVALQPLTCYWQGSAAAWQGFVEQMTKCFPQVELPDEPEPWLGNQSLNSIINRLQGAPAEARILCAGSQCSPAGLDSRLPAGEVALLWLIAPKGGVRLSRGEWFDASSELLPTVASRAQQQSDLQAPPQFCVSFSQPDEPHLPAQGWTISQHLQDANFGDLERMEGMVAQTLAASYVEQHQVPCAWLANDPHHTLTLGIVEPDDSTI